MKPTFTMYFADSPDVTLAETRANIARLLRAYRRNPRFKLTRRGARSYAITHSQTTAIIEAI